MADTDLILTNNSNNKQFLLRGVGMRPKKAQPAVPIPLISTTPTNTLLFRFFGQTEQVNITAALFNDGTDVSNGTESGGVTTVDAQLKYLMNTIFTDEFDTTWNLQTSGSGTLYETAITGVLLDVEPEYVPGKPTVRMVAIQFHRGKLAAV